jgi:hypothetical protein
MDFDGIVCLGDLQFHRLLASGVMDFMESVPTEPSFHPILSLMIGNFVQFDLFGLSFSSNQHGLSGQLLPTSTDHYFPLLLIQPFRYKVIFF